MDENISAEEIINYAVETYSDMVYRIALNITQNPHNSFDVSQEVFIRLLKNHNKIKDKEHLKAWLIRVTVNCARTFMRSESSRQLISFDEIKESDFIYTLDEDFEITKLVWQLPEKYRIVIYLFYYEEMKISRIAQALGISQSAVKLRLSRGREKFKNLMEKES